MSVNKIKIKIGNIDENKYINIPVSLDFNSIGQSEVVNREFVDIEVDKSINPIIDYEKVRFIPLTSDDGEVTDITFNLNFLNSSGNLITPTNYSDIGFVDDDIRYKKNRFLNSFLRLSFYDSDKPTNQNLVSIITIFSKITKNDVDSTGRPKTANSFPVRFIISDPIKKPEGFAEGFYIYHFKNNVFDSIENLYMRAEFNNAATGKITKFINSSDVLPINEIINKLHINYLLKRTNTGYYYSLNPEFNNISNITENGNAITINLYEIKVQ